MDTSTTEPKIYSILLILETDGEGNIDIMCIYVPYTAFNSHFFCALSHKVQSKCTHHCVT